MKISTLLVRSFPFILTRRNTKKEGGKVFLRHTFKQRWVICQLITRRHLWELPESQLTVWERQKWFSFHLSLCRSHLKAIQEGHWPSLQLCAIYMRHNKTDSSVIGVSEGRHKPDEKTKCCLRFMFFYEIKYSGGLLKNGKCFLYGNILKTCGSRPPKYHRQLRVCL